MFLAVSKNRFLGTARQSRDTKVEVAGSTTSIEAFQSSLKIIPIVVPPPIIVIKLI